MPNTETERPHTASMMTPEPGALASLASRRATIVLELPDMLDLYRVAAESTAALQDWACRVIGSEIENAVGDEGFCHECIVVGPCDCIDPEPATDSYNEPTGTEHDPEGRGY